MSDNIVQFALPAKPNIREREPDPDRRHIAVLPIRAVFDQKLTHGGLQVLAAICSFANRAGITWVSQTRLGKDLGISQQAVAKQFKQLRELGYLETVKKGFKAERTDTIRVIFDSSVDAATAIAITSSVEDTRPPEMRKEQQQQIDNTIDHEGLRRIQDMIKGVIKPMNQPLKEYVMPKSGDTLTVAKMKKEIAAHKAKKTAANHNPEVVNGGALQLHPNHNPEVVHNTENTVLGKSIKESIKEVIYNKEVIYKYKDLNTVLHNQKRLSDAEIEDNLEYLLAAYQAEGLTPKIDQLVEGLMQMHKDGR